MRVSEIELPEIFTLLFLEKSLPNRMYQIYFRTGEPIEPVCAHSSDEPGGFVEKYELPPGLYQVVRRSVSKSGKQRQQKFSMRICRGGKLRIKNGVKLPFRRVKLNEEESVWAFC